MLSYENTMPRIYQRASYDSKTSCDFKASSGYDSSSDSSEEEYSLSPPFGLVFCNRMSLNKPLPPLPRGGRRVRFVVEKPLPPLPGQKTRRSSSRDCFGEQAWWVKSRCNWSDDLEDSMEKKLH